MSARSRGMEICFIWMLNICLGLHLLVSKTRGLEAKRPCRQSLKKHKDSCLLLGIVTSSYLISSASHLTKKNREFSWQGCTWKPAGRGALEGSSGRKEVTVRKRKSKATTKSQEEVKCRVRQKRLNSQLFGWGQWERKHVIFQQEQEEIFWDQLLPSLLSEMLWWQSRTEFCWRNQRLIFAKKKCFSGILCNPSLPRAANTSAGHWLIWCRVQRKSMPIYSRCWSSGGTYIDISTGTTHRCLCLSWRREL